MPAFPYPFAGTLEELIEIQEQIPIDPDVPFAEEYRAIYRDTNGQPWGEKTSDRSKLAVRLWFAGWPRQGLIDLGLEPKHVENFRSKHRLTTGVRGRKFVRKPSASRSDVILNANSGGSVIASTLAEIRSNTTFVQGEIERLRRELEIREGELEQLQRMYNAVSPQAHEEGTEQ
ncbi:hypothetical protein [Pseudomonas sp. B14(2017)]|uniref:hypothetical protein n=1 Tax=Pseudomonas sp. B14(2017) TaxID=1981745 RepID=UPI000A1D7355|nr:hypothetical protein [Pseudomonas sp. B14(2017)]